jgi:hypothetical protein
MPRDEHGDSCRYDLFVSYSTQDSKLVDGLLKLLRLNGQRVFRDSDSIQPGEEWESRLRQAITQSKSLLVVWCCHSAESKWVAEEIKLAYEHSIPIIPVVVCSVPPSKGVSKFQWIDMKTLIVHKCKPHEDDVELSLIDPDWVIQERSAMGLTSDGAYFFPQIEADHLETYYLTDRYPFPKLSFLTTLVAAALVVTTPFPPLLGDTVAAIANLLVLCLSLSAGILFLASLMRHIRAQRAYRTTTSEARVFATVVYRAMELSQKRILQREFR